MQKESRKIIYFEGPDRCGKTTTRKIFEEMTAFKHMCYDRGFISNLAFDILRGAEVTDTIDFAESIKQHINRSPFETVIVLFIPTQYVVDHIANATNESTFNVETTSAAFKKAVELVETAYKCRIIRISVVTVGCTIPTDIAMKLVELIESEVM